MTAVQRAARGQKRREFIDGAGGGGAGCCVKVAAAGWGTACGGGCVDVHCGMNARVTSGWRALQRQALRG